MTLILQVLLILTCIALPIVGYTVRNLLKRTETQEDIIEKQFIYLSNIQDVITQSKYFLEELDSKGTFQSDDEVGVFFKFMQEIQTELNQYIGETIPQKDPT
jgi:hypothetical protein